jgi:hypothetical protein
MSDSDNLPATRAAFDYGIVASQHVGEVRKAADHIRSLMKDSIFDIGRALSQVKSKLVDHGQFGTWIEAEFSMSLRTAERYMTAARFADEHPDIAANVSVTEVYLLSAPKSPPEVIEAVTERIEAGEATSPKMVRTLLDTARSRAEKPPVRGRAAPATIAESVSPPDIDDHAPVVVVKRDPGADAASAQAAFLVHASMRGNVNKLLDLMKAGGDGNCNLYYDLVALSAMRSGAA